MIIENLLLGSTAIAEGTYAAIAEVGFLSFFA